MGPKKPKKRSEKKSIEELSLNNGSLNRESEINRNDWYYESRDIWMLKYEIDEEGKGQISLPPDLSTLLQSEKVSILHLQVACSSDQFGIYNLQAHEYK